MFNPQRRSKVCDIYMQERTYALHLDRIRQIEKSQARKDEAQGQLAQRLAQSKKEVTNRVKSSIFQENINLYRRLLEEETRKPQIPIDPEKKEQSPRHHNSYYSRRKMDRQIRRENSSMFERMISQYSEVPTKSTSKEHFKSHKKLMKRLRKLPTINRYEQDYRRYFTQKLSFGDERSSRAISQLA